MQYIRDNYGEDPADYNKACTDLEQLRQVTSINRDYFDVFLEKWKTQESEVLSVHVYRAEVLSVYRVEMKNDMYAPAYYISFTLPLHHTSIHSGEGVILSHRRCIYL